MVASFLTKFLQEFSGAALMHGIDCSLANFHSKLEEESINACLFGAKGWIHHNHIHQSILDPCFPHPHIPEISQHKLIISPVNFLVQHFPARFNILLIDLKPHHKLRPHVNQPAHEHARPDAQISDG